MHPAHFFRLMNFDALHQFIQHLWLQLLGAGIFADGGYKHVGGHGFVRDLFQFIPQRLNLT